MQRRGDRGIDSHRVRQGSISLHPVGRSAWPRWWLPKKSNGKVHFTYFFGHGKVVLGEEDCSVDRIWIRPLVYPSLFALRRIEGPKFWFHACQTLHLGQTCPTRYIQDQLVPSSVFFFFFLVRRSLICWKIILSQKRSLFISFKF